MAWSGAILLLDGEMKEMHLALRFYSLLEETAATKTDCKMKQQINGLTTDNYY